MKYAKYAILVSMLAGTLFGECDKCSDKTSKTVVVEDMTQCEKDELKKAEDAVSAVKTKIRQAHGEPNSIIGVWGGSYGTHCTDLTYKTYEIYQYKVLVETQTYNACGGIFTSGSSLR